MRGILVTALGLSTVLFAIVYTRLLETVAPGLASPYAKADIGRRFSAVMVDALLVMTAWVLFRHYDSAIYLILGALYVLLKDSIAGRSVGKFCFGLVVIDLLSGRPCGRVASAKRNILLLIPGPNISAVFLESATIVRDPQGQRLGDRLAHTQVVDGLGVRDFAAAFQRWWQDFVARLERTPGKPRRLPVKAVACVLLSGAACGRDH
jgi:RDD family